MNFQIYTMFVNRKDLLLNALAHLGKYTDQTVILDNSPVQNLELTDFSGEIVCPPVPLFCAQSYNMIQKMAQDRSQDAFFIMHSDALPSEAVVEQTLAIAQNLTDHQVPWGVLFTNYDVLCLHNTAILKDFHWDPYLPLYYTDVDFYRRLQLAGITLVETNLPVGHVEGGSTSMKADPALYQFVTSNYPAWRHYYISKWGGEKNEETFTTPFGL